MRTEQAVGRKLRDWQLSCVSGRPHFGRSVTAGCYPLKPRAPVTSAGQTAALQHGERAAFMKTRILTNKCLNLYFRKILPEA